MSVTQSLRPIFAARKRALEIELLAVELALLSACPGGEADDLADSLQGWSDSLRAYVQNIPEITPGPRQ